MRKIEKSQSFTIEDVDVSVYPSDSKAEVVPSLQGAKTLGA
jgi:hypothetical protein